MKIIKLTSQNVKNLKAIEISPDGNVVRLSGKNGAGKSAVLDSIFCALTGTRLDDPIRHGEEKAEVTIDMGEFKVRKRWTEKGEYLEVFNADGDKKQSPQTFLDSVIGKLSFDPLSFQGMKQKEQWEILRSMVGLDFSDLAEQQKKVYDERTILNSKIKGSVAILSGLEAPSPSTPDVELTFTDELEKINAIRDRRAFYLSAVDARVDLEGDIGEITRGISEREQRIAQLTEEIESLKIERQGFKAKYDAIVVPSEVTENQITAAEVSLKDIENKNVLIRSAKRYREEIKNGEKLRQESDKLTQEIERIEQDKSTRISNAKYPIEGLLLSDDCVIFNGIPFSRLSTGQQIRVSTAIAMKLNPKLKIILIREGSLLDASGKAEIFSIAKDNDYQIFIEEVDETGEVGFFIQDGSITKIDGKDASNEEQASV